MRRKPLVTVSVVVELMFSKTKGVYETCKRHLLDTTPYAPESRLFRDHIIEQVNYSVHISSKTDFSLTAEVDRIMEIVNKCSII